MRSIGRCVFDTHAFNLKMPKMSNFKHHRRSEQHLKRYYKNDHYKLVHKTVILANNLHFHFLRIKNISMFLFTLEESASIFAYF